MTSGFDSRFRQSVLASAALVAALASAGAASATPVARQADLRLTLEILNFPEVVISATGATVSVDSAVGTLSIAAGVIAQQAPQTLPITPTTTFSSVVASGIANLSGLFSLGGGAVTTPSSEVPCATPVPSGIACVTAGGANLGGQMGLTGTLNVVVVPALVTIPMWLDLGGFGVGGLTQQPKSPAGFWFEAAPWTQGVGKVGIAATSQTTWMGHFMTNAITVTYTMTWTTVASATGGGGSVQTANSGTITLVSPTWVSALGNLLPVMSKLEIHFIPEPATALLLAGGLAGLAAARRGRSRP